MDKDRKRPSDENPGGEEVLRNKISRTGRHQETILPVFFFAFISHPVCGLSRHFPNIMFDREDWARAFLEKNLANIGQVLSSSIKFVGNPPSKSILKNLVFRIAKSMLNKKQNPYSLDMEVWPTDEENKMLHNIFDANYIEQVYTLTTSEVISCEQAMELAIMKHKDDHPEFDPSNCRHVFVDGLPIPFHVWAAAFNETKVSSIAQVLLQYSKESLGILGRAEFALCHVTQLAILRAVAWIHSQRKTPTSLETWDFDSKQNKYLNEQDVSVIKKEVFNLEQNYNLDISNIPHKMDHKKPQQPLEDEDLENDLEVSKESENESIHDETQTNAIADNSETFGISQDEQGSQYNVFSRIGVNTEETVNLYVPVPPGNNIVVVYNEASSLTNMMTDQNEVPSSVEEVIETEQLVEENSIGTDTFNTATNEQPSSSNGKAPVYQKYYNKPTNFQYPETNSAGDLILSPESTISKDIFDAALDAWNKSPEVKRQVEAGKIFLEKLWSKKELKSQSLSARVCNGKQMEILDPKRVQMIYDCLEIMNERQLTHAEREGVKTTVLRDHRSTLARKSEKKNQT